MIIFTAKVTLAENPCGTMFPVEGKEEWGVGGYVIPDEFTVKVYVDNNSKQYGSLVTDHSIMLLIDTNGMQINYEITDFIYIGHYGNEILKINDCPNSEFVEVLSNSTKETLYIEKKMAKKAGAVFKTYKEILIEETEKIRSSENEVKVGVNLKKSCLNIRTQPKQSAEKLHCAIGNDWYPNYEIVLYVNKIEGNWAEVVYRELHPENDYPNNDEDCYWKVKNKKIGWVKAIDDRGFPNIWFAVSGY